MDRFIFKDGGDFHPGRVTLHGAFVAGVAGAVPAIATGWLRRAGIAGCVLSGTGLYTFTLQDAYATLLNYVFNIDQVTYNATHAAEGVLGAVPAVGSNPATIAMQAVNMAGAATAVTAGDTIRMTLLLARIQGTG